MSLITMQEAFEKAEAMASEAEGEAVQTSEQLSSDDDSAEKPDESEGEEKPEEKPGDDKPTPEEARNWRAEKRRKVAQLKAERDAVEAERAKIAQAERGLKMRHERYVKAEAAKERGDVLAAVEALGIDPAELNERLLERITGVDPKVREVEKKLKELELREQKQREEAERMRHETQLQQQIRNWEAQLATTFSKDQDAALKELAGFPIAIQFIRVQQEREYNETGEIPDPKRIAREMVLPAMREDYARMQKIFGAQAPSSKPESSAGGRKKVEAEKAGKSPKTLSTNRTAEAAAPAPSRSGMPTMAEAFAIAEKKLAAMKE